MPIRPDQTPPERLTRWSERRTQVGARIRDIRQKRNLTQEALGLEAGIGRNMIIGIEWGRKSLAYERLWDIAEVLGVDVCDLLDDPADETEPSA